MHPLFCTLSIFFFKGGLEWQEGFFVEWEAEEFFSHQEGGLANFLSLTYTQKRRKKEASLSLFQELVF